MSYALHTISLSGVNILQLHQCLILLSLRLDENREKLVKAKIIPLLLKALDSEDQSVILQCFRAIGNICMENGKLCQLSLRYSFLGAA